MITSDEGLKILIDPYGEGVGYRIHRINADVVTISHEHFDHNNVNMIKNRDRALILRGLKKNGDWNIIDRSIDGVDIYNIPLYHDDNMGKERGKNSGFIYKIDGLKILHLGDLGHILTKPQIDRIGKIDILLIPVGGVYTIGAEEATKVIDQLNPKIVIPMHYKTEPVTLPIEPIDRFIKDKKNIKRVEGYSISISKESLPENQEIILLHYK
jgi:L-ascorbate metabolism protein UlaG (beta-lactamase superfamily)